MPIFRANVVEKQSKKTIKRRSLNILYACLQLELYLGRDKINIYLGSQWECAHDWAEIYNDFNRKVSDKNNTNSSKDKNHNFQTTNYPIVVKKAFYIISVLLKGFMAFPVSFLLASSSCNFQQFLDDQVMRNLSILAEHSDLGGRPIHHIPTLHLASIYVIHAFATQFQNRVKPYLNKNYINASSAKSQAQNYRSFGAQVFTSKRSLVHEKPTYFSYVYYSLWLSGERLD